MLGPYNKTVVAAVLAVILLGFLYWGNEATSERLIEAILAVLMPILVYLVPNMPAPK